MPVITLENGSKITLSGKPTEMKSCFSGDQIAKAMDFFRQAGVMSGYASIDGSEFVKFVDGKIVEDDDAS